MAEYQLTYYPDQIIRVADQAYIPADENNTDYQIYLQWLKEGNEPDPYEGPDLFPQPQS